MATSCRIAPDLGYDYLTPRYPTPRNLPEQIRKFPVYVVDPSLGRDVGRVDTLSIPFEPLQPGPLGALFQINMAGAPSDLDLTPCDLDSRDSLLRGGYRPDPASAAFHGQMVYGVAMSTYETFRMALGRTIGLRDANGLLYCDRPLTLRPFGMEASNAYYNRDAREVVFGYFPARAGNDIPEGRLIFTSLSSDVIVHEVTHALLDSLKPGYMRPSNPDVWAFHEAFADIVAIFNRFSFQKFARAVIQKEYLRFNVEGLSSMLAAQLAMASISQPSLRNLGEKTSYDDVDLEEIHARGKVLAEAVFEAFATIAVAKAQATIEMVTSKFQLSLDTPVPPLLLDKLADQLNRTARQFRNICIRAIDYCPPVDIDFGDYLRALITADTELVPYDRWGYREALTGAFRRRNIYPHDMKTLSEKALRWKGPRKLEMFMVPELALQHLGFEGDPGLPAPRANVLIQARALTNWLCSDDGLAEEIGLERPGDQFDTPELVSVRPTRRVGPDGQIAFDVIAEVVQRGEVPYGSDRLQIMGGATLIFGPFGELRYAIRKRVNQRKWISQQINAARTYGVNRRSDGRLDINSAFPKDLCFRGRS